MAGNARLCLHRRSGRFRTRLRCRAYVPGAGTAVKDPPIAFDLLSSAAVNRFVCCDHAIVVDGLHPLHDRARQRIFHWATIATRENYLGRGRLDSLCVHFAGASFAPAVAKTRRGPLCIWFYRRCFGALGNHLRLAKVPF